MDASQLDKPKGLEQLSSFQPIRFKTLKVENFNTMTDQRSTFPLKGIQQWGFIVLRIVVGWHFLYEGIVF